MSTPNLDTFHVVCRNLDYRKPLESLLEEFRHGTIADKDRNRIRSTRAFASPGSARV